MRCLVVNVFFDIVGVLLFSLMLIVPTNYMSVKLFLIFLLVLRVLFISKHRTICCNKVVLLILFLIVFKGAFWLWYGVLNDNSISNIVALYPFSCIWPILYLFLFCNIYSKERFHNVCMIILYSHLFIVLYNLYALLSVFIGIEPISIFQSDPVFMLDTDEAGISNPSLQQLVYTTPFLFTIIISGEKQRIKTAFWCFVFCLTVLVLLLSGRGMMILVILLLPIIPVGISFFSTNKKHKFTKYYIATILLFVLSFGYLYSSRILEKTLKPLVEKFDSSSDYVRFSQREMLIGMWNEAPLLGHGLGTVYYNRDRGYHNGVESMYHADLANTGIIGFTLFLLYIILVYYFAVKIYRQTNDIYIFACLVGLSFYLLASATNPFLASFDRLYPIYLCLCIINIGNEKNSCNSNSTTL